MKTNNKNKKKEDQAKSFSEIKIGDKAKFEITINERMHNVFTSLSGDYSPIHTDEKFCSKTRFKKRIGYAFLLTSFLSRLYGEYLPGGSSVCIKQEAKFIRPFFIGDRIRVAAEVIGKIESTKFVEIKTEMYRKNECIFKGIGTVQILFDNIAPALYETDGKQLTKEDFINALLSAGIKKGDTIFVHSDISVFGKLCSNDRNYLLKSIIDAIKLSVGEQGTIIMPTFTYSFCNNEIFDLQNSKSTVGILTEYFRKQQNVIRTIHPIFSVAVWGRGKSEFLKISKDSFDKNSVFGKLHEMKGKIVFLGAPFQSITFLHYIEQMAGVPYRYMKKFKGVIKNGNKQYDDEYSFFVRDIDKGVIFDTSRTEKYLLKDKIMKEVVLGAGRILVVEADTLYKEGIKLLNKDLYFFLKNKPK